MKSFSTMPATDIDDTMGGLEENKPSTGGGARRTTITTERLTQGIEAFRLQIEECALQHECQMAEKCCEVDSLETSLNQRDNDNEDLVEIISKMKRNKATTAEEKQTIRDC